jgi:DUF2959 family protein
MKTTLFLAFPGLLLAFALATGCKSSGSQQADSTAMHMDEMHAAIVSLKESVSATATSLAKVVEQADVDPKTPFEQYEKNVSATKSGVDRAGSQVKSMKEQGATYFAEWEKQAATITDPDLKEAADERRVKLSKAVGRVSEAMTEAQAELAPYLTSITDMQTYLSNDLTPSGIKSVKGKSKDISKAANSIGKKLDDVIEALEKGAPEFKTAKPPPPPPKS